MGATNNKTNLLDWFNKNVKQTIHVKDIKKSLHTVYIDQMIDNTFVVSLDENPIKVNIQSENQALKFAEKKFNIKFC